MPCVDTLGHHIATVWTPYAYSLVSVQVSLAAQRVVPGAAAKFVLR